MIPHGPGHLPRYRIRTQAAAGPAHDGSANAPPPTSPPGGWPASASAWPMSSRPRQSAPSAAWSSLRPAPSRMEVSDSHSGNAGWVTGGPGAEQRDEVGMSRQGGTRRVRDRAEIVGPLAGA